jgi:hypothetical protein
VLLLLLLLLLLSSGHAVEINGSNSGVFNRWACHGRQPDLVVGC